MGPLTGSKVRKEHDKGIYCHFAYLTSTQSPSCEIPGWLNHKIVGRDINNLRYAGDCSHEIRRQLLLRIKAMTNLDSRQPRQSRDIILLTKVHIVKTIVFPVVMHGYESWNTKKAEQQRIDAFKMWCWRRLLRVTWTARILN